MVSIAQAMRDENLFGRIFAGESWVAWRALLGGFYGLPLERVETGIFRQLTNRTDAPDEPANELWLAVGRRGGKTNVSAVVAVFEACFRDHRPKLAPGEVATVMVIAADRKQARTAMRYISGLVEAIPMLRAMVVKETTESIEFRNRAVIEVHTASFRAVRGYTLAAVICDEIAFWMADGTSPDKEIITALRPALATLNGKLIALSSPYAKRGVLWATFKRYFGADDRRVLVARAPTLKMNPTLDPEIVAQALRDDPEAARAEYLAEFRGDLSMFINPEMLQGCTRQKPLEMPKAPGQEYVAFVDPAGGGSDEFTLSIAHADGETAVVDLVRGRRGSPADCVAEFVPILQSYGISSVTGDRYAGRWPRDEFERHGVTYVCSEMDRSALYMEFLSALNSGRVELPPDKLMSRQFEALERRTSRAGRDSIDHPPGGHDDRANAVAGVVAHITESGPIAQMFLRKRTRDRLGLSPAA